MSIGELSNKNVHRKDQAYKGSETAWADFMMTAKMHVHIAGAIMLVQGLLTILLNLVTTGKAWYLLGKYVISSIASFDFPFAAGGALLKILSHNLWLLMITLPVWFSYPLFLRYFKKRAAAQAAQQYEGGSKELEEEELIGAIRKSGEATSLNIGKTPVPKSAEIKHSFSCGRPGVGKTVAMLQLMFGLRKRGAKAVIYDFKGDYVSKLYDPATDIIFNPLDKRNLGNNKGWTIFNEMKTYTDVDAIAASLIPQTISNQDPFWNDAARDVFAGILHYLYQQGKTTNRDIWEMVCSPLADIAKKLKNTKGGERGYNYIQDASAKQALSVFAVLMQYVKSFEFMAAADGAFCVKDWLSDGKPGFLFITNYSDIKDTLKPVLSLMLDLLGRRLLALPDDYNRRVFFMIDEFGTLQRLSTIVQLLTLSRSKGGSVWIGIQDIGQVDKIYGRELRQAIFNACGTNLLFSANDPDTQKFLSDAIGDVRYINSEETRTMGSADERDGITLMRRRITEKLVLPSDIKNLPDLTAYLKLPNFDMAKIKLEYKSYPERNEAFMMKPGLSLEEIKQAAAEAKAKDDALEGPEDKKRDKAKKELKDMLKDRKEQQKELEKEQKEPGEDIEQDINIASD